MALATYDDLKTAVANWSHRSDLLPVMDDLILAAETHIFQNVRIRSMETSLSATIVGMTAAGPSDYLGMRHAFLTMGGLKRAVEVCTPDYINKTFPLSATGTPAYVAIDRGSFIFGPAPADGNVLQGTYFAKPTALATAVNAIFTECPTLYLFATLAELEPYTENDARVPLWIAKRDELIRGVNGNSERARYSGPMTMKVA